MALAAPSVVATHQRKNTFFFEFAAQKFGFRVQGSGFKDKNWVTCKSLCLILNQNRELPFLLCLMPIACMSYDSMAPLMCKHPDVITQPYLSVLHPHIAKRKTLLCIKTVKAESRVNSTKLAKVFLDKSRGFSFLKVYPICLDRF